ncbi:MAG: GlsB/YeaQ/YmgE family stress response membrane protein [Dehalococcoidia bacterium]
MGLLGWLVLGLLAGWLAQLVTKESTGKGGCTGLVLTTVVGIVGAAVGGFVGTVLGWGTVNDFDARSLLLAFIGAVVVLLVLGAVRGGGKRRR